MYRAGAEELSRAQFSRRVGVGAQVPADGEALGRPLACAACNAVRRGAAAGGAADASGVSVDLRQMARPRNCAIAGVVAYNPLHAATVVNQERLRIQMGTLVPNHTSLWRRGPPRYCRGRSPKPVSRPLFCRVPPGMRSIHKHKCHLCMDRAHTQGNPAK